MRPMTRREFTRAVAAAGGAMAAGIPAWGRGADAAPKRPNILWIIVDDLRYDTFGCEGRPLVKTPNIDRLAGEGVRFANSFVTTSICGPSRQCFMTGLHEDRRRRKKGREFSAYLKEAGYATFEYGKLRGTGTARPFKKIDGETMHLTEAAPVAIERFLKGRPQDKPFCISLGLVCTHAPFIPAKWTADLYKDAVFPIPRTRTKEHFEGLHEYLRTSLNFRRYKNVFPPDNPEEAVQRFIRNYMRCVSSIDRSVGSWTFWTSTNWPRIRSSSSRPTTGSSWASTGSGANG